MRVRRIVANIETADPGKARVFYRDLLELLMDHGGSRPLVRGCK